MATEFVAWIIYFAIFLICILIVTIQPTLSLTSRLAELTSKPSDSTESSAELTRSLAEDLTPRSLPNG